ncbi:MAG: NifU N-terminal domain-containing protein [Candidatus Colwellbacteria bacterium]|jgi:hypothetical protein|nr:NifU N-terminal domain-containing protein [Candidatus Colwellbacteria bacterium]MCK9497511.1 NifU N-terminal domain-containing protein [Candidatus Colwellbacteria bacterium]MDD3752439.1 NifU N-terminal domain-containing protein [Candidatus Colwellbacteria bacterium]MDD4818691.1 NifU N-terminal domain-containing protein [Candidatus Colwellbacteria bacterium]
MKLRVLRNGDEKKATIYLSEMISTAKEIIYESDGTYLPKAISSLVNAIPSVKKVKVMPYSIELELCEEEDIKFISECARHIINRFDPSFSLKQYKKDTGGDGDLNKSIPTPFSLGKDSGFISLDDQNEDYFDATASILMIDGVSKVRRNGNYIEVEKSYFAKWTSIIPAIEKVVRRILREGIY